MSPSNFHKEDKTDRNERDQTSHSHQSSSHPPQLGREGCPLPTTSCCPRKAQASGARSTTSENRHILVPCDPQPITARAPLTHQALKMKTKMNRFCRRRPRGRWVRWNVLVTLNLIQRYVPHRSASDEPQLPHVETVFLPEISANIVGRFGGDLNHNWNCFGVHI